ncbi:peptidase domain-containing ABC transporter [Commensalibacter papalotli (ex Botero et al. 2024)]|uniref:Contain an N-terminal double-glycine peptidase domain (SunT) (PDB:3K8U) n=1 Tax=Commensalibacter papalotli (ex Botero et al. 2024) TaxID=2972766 RepID=A0ABM9HKX6_9PROT|nr:peptidase domain-containing ABC transporter [Commensalibacter papalotli (ex Botero et al. 2024)]CAI3932394.1 ABC-type bacteriocin/lantibiotic exporters [Commensalibacter papalotli (ex Botero et al. 2024)]CAI3946299.1 ABC-type bacteriocin/lantibiotic exporters [Commensalibacter papalotli (ex Botero et al. 2024)]
MIDALKKLEFNFRHKTPVILQVEAAECGLACLAMIMGHYKNYIDLTTFRRRESISIKGITLQNIIDVAHRNNLTTRPLRLEMEELNKLKLPCILHWSLNHFVVLIAVKSYGIIINDPAHGQRKILWEEVSKEFTGVALEVSPNEKFERKDERNNLKLRDLFRKTDGLKTTLTYLFFASLGLELIAIIMPMASQVIIDEVIVTLDKNLLTTIAVGVGLLILLQMIIATARTWMVMLFSTRLNVQWNAGLFDHLTRLPLDYFLKRHVGDVLSRFGSLGIIQTTITTDMVQAVMDGLMAVGMLIMLFIYGKWLAVVTIIAVTLDAIVRFIAYRPYKQASEEGIVYSAKKDSHFIETLRGMASIKLLGLRERRRARWLNLLVDSINVGLKTQRYDLIFGRINDAIFASDRLIMMVVGAYFVMDNKMSVGMLVAFLSYKDQFTGRIGSLIGAIFKLRMLSIQSDRISDIALTPTEKGTADYSLTHDITALLDKKDYEQLECRDLGFRYSPAEPWVFQKLNIQIPQGKSVAIIGPSGCGKSTLLKAMMGLTFPEEGEILYKGKNITKQSLDIYRQNIAGVLQDDGLFSGSIADNICAFDDNPDHERIVDCAKKAAIYADIMTMPMQFETFVGDMGSSLSGGQKQRVIIARALYRQPDILFLDEATSHLDELTESHIADTLKTMHVTRVIVAHRPATVALCDLIIIMDPQTIQKGEVQIVNRTDLYPDE